MFAVGITVRDREAWRTILRLGSQRAAVSLGKPTLFLSDHKGVIRYRWLVKPGDKKIDEAIEALLKEAEPAGDGKKNSK